MDEERKKQLESLIEDGDECAVGDVLLEDGKTATARVKL